jgi:hypothetical protein
MRLMFFELLTITFCAMCWFLETRPRSVGDTEAALAEDTPARPHISSRRFVSLLGVPPGIGKLSGRSRSSRVVGVMSPRNASL